MHYNFDLTDMEFALLRDHIHAKTGIHFKDEKKSFFRMKLYPRVTALGYSSYSDYIGYLKFTTMGEGEFSHMIALLTNNETYFFREWPQLEAFRDVILPQIRQARNGAPGKKLKVVSAGCSTGEEAYTLSMLIFETGAFFWDWEVSVLGVDISGTALEHARKGKYYPISFRMTEEKYLGKFFLADADHRHVKDNIRKTTSFVHANIVDPSVSGPMGGADVIFCRNVLIYFSLDAARKAIENFHRALKPGGYLLLGHSETLTDLSQDFTPIRLADTVIYRKKD